MLAPRRLHQQLVLIMGALLVLVIAVFGAYTAQSQSDAAAASAQELVNTHASNLASASADLILTDSLDVLEELLRRSANFNSIVDILVVSPDGQTLGHVRHDAHTKPVVLYDPLSSRTLPPVSSGHTQTFDEAKSHMVAWQAIQVNKVIGWVRVTQNVQDLIDQQQRIWRSIWVAMAVAVLASTTLLMLFLRRPMSLLDKARQFSMDMVESPGIQIELAGPYELRQLYKGLNESSMLRRQQQLLLDKNISDLQRHEAKLAEQNEQLSAISSLSPDGLVTFCQDDRVQFVNAAFSALTGLRGQQLVGHPRSELDLMLKDLADDETPFAGLDACFADPIEGQTVTAQTLHRQSSPPMALTLRGMFSQAQTVSRVLYVCDVTQQHRLDQMKSEFLQMAAHELRTPMASILGFTELMLTRDMSPVKQKELLGRVYRQSQSMAEILNELLDLARIESRRGQDFNLAQTDLADVVQAVIAGFQPPEGRDPPLVSPAPGPMLALVDEGKAQRAVLNVLSNAYKYSPNGGPVTVRYVVPDAVDGRQSIGVVIEDHGLGLSPEHLARMGERFFRADKSGHIPGTGLGISIVQEIMALMGGRMQVDSTLGQGTTVTLWFS
ncbi:MAG: PAS domain-containing sensor histidine kinase [Aquabacterium sp.]|nr:PAS domain-containing sensor histidine kinase [Aquabacterium sp.]